MSGPVKRRPKNATKAAALPGLTKAKPKKKGKQHPMVEAVEVARDEAGDKDKAPVVRVRVCPVYQITQWERIERRTEVPKGWGLTACFSTSLREMDRTKEYQRWCRLRLNIADAEAEQGLSLDELTTITRVIGSVQRPGLHIDPRTPAGDTEPLSFRSTETHYQRLGARAESLGMAPLGPLAVVMIGHGMALLAGEMMHRQALEAVKADYADLLKRIDRQRERVQGLFGHYLKVDKGDQQ